MRAMGLNAPGQPLQLAEVPKPTPALEQVLLRIAEILGRSGLGASNQQGARQRAKSNGQIKGRRSGEQSIYLY